MTTVMKKTTATKTAMTAKKAAQAATTSVAQVAGGGSALEAPSPAKKRKAVRVKNINKYSFVSD